MKKILTLLFCAGLAWSVSAQEEAVLTHYMFNPVLVNPAAAGFQKDQHDIFVNVRSGWTNIPGAPRTYALSYNGAVGKRLGLGGMLYNENIASLNEFRGQLSIAFGYDMEELELSAGFSTQYHRTSIDGDYKSNDLFDPTDNILDVYNDGERLFDASIGFYGRYDKKINFGLSFPSLIRTRLDEIEGETSEGGNLQYFTAMIGGDVKVNESRIRLQPSIMAKNLRDVDFHIDFNMLASFLDDHLIGGAKYTAWFGDNSLETGNGTLGAILGVKYNAVRFIYSYDVFLGDFQKYNGGSHEVTVNFQFKGGGKYDRSRKYRQE